MLRVVPLELSEANTLVRLWHRHHKPVPGHRFSIGALADSQLVGAAIVSRPVARMVDQGRVVEVARLVTNGHKNACSILYAAAARAAKAIGYDRIQTYILNSEHGSSLKAAGWWPVRETAGGSWTRQKRYRKDLHPLQVKLLWCKVLNKEAPPWRSTTDLGLPPSPQLGFTMEESG